eukprot:COSAG03_NODE_4817_length_1422_cov_10.699169_1_plen_255_part_10
MESTRHGCNAARVGWLRVWGFRHHWQCDPEPAAGALSGARAAHTPFQEPFRGGPCLRAASLMEPQRSARLAPSDAPEASGDAPRSLAALAAASERTEDALLGCSTQDLDELFKRLSVDGTSKGRIEREMDTRRGAAAAAEPNERRQPAADEQHPSLPLDSYLPDGQFHFIDKSYPGLQCIHEDPRIFVVHDFLSAEECDGLIARSLSALCSLLSALCSLLSALCSLSLCPLPSALPPSPPPPLSLCVCVCVCLSI